MRRLTTAPELRPDVKIDRLAALPIFEGCTQREVAIAAGVVEHVHVRAGTTLVHEGQQALQGFLILEGRVATTLRRKPQGEAGPGTPVGMVSLLDDWDYTRTVVALEDVEALVFTTKTIWVLLDEAPRAAKALMRLAMSGGVS
jgi:CRP-like cAMP-binding protein